MCVFGCAYLFMCGAGFEQWKVVNIFNLDTQVLFVRQTSKIYRSFISSLNTIVRVSPFVWRVVESSFMRKIRSECVCTMGVWEYVYMWNGITELYQFHINIIRATYNLLPLNTNEQSTHWNNGIVHTNVCTLKIGSIVLYHFRRYFLSLPPFLVFFY